MLNVFVASLLVLTLSVVYILAKTSPARASYGRSRKAGTLLRLLRIAVRRSARRDVRWLTAHEREKWR